MAHQSMSLYIERIKNRFPQYFKNVIIVDFGSLDINGNNRKYFEESQYTGVDLGIGNNVDVISMAHEYKPDKKFDVVITTELFEHDIFWKQTFLNGINLLKPNGLYIFTCAGYERKEHGTIRSEGWTSPFTSKIPAWDIYYENRTTKDFINLMDFEKEFIHYSFEYDGSGEYQDLYFFGIKRMNKIKISKGDNRIYLMPSELVENVTLEIYKDNSIIYTAKSDTLLQEYNYWHQPNSSLDDGLVIVKIFSNDDLVEEKRL